LCFAEEVNVIIGDSWLVCLFIFIRITQKLLNRFSQNAIKEWHMGRGINRHILAVIRIMFLFYVCAFFCAFSKEVLFSSALVGLFV